MAIEDFDVDAEKVRGDYFPHRTAFSGSSAPTSTRVADFITEEAGELAGLLLEQDIAASSVVSGVTYATPSTWTPAYTWCRKYVALAVAIRVLSVSTQGAADDSSKWGERLAAMAKKLASGGATALGDAGLDGSGAGPLGPSSHISELNLDAGDEALNASSVEARFRRDDQL